ncbi:restriction endonuclease [Flavobacterium cheongpyeongense]|uniref:Restriction endonuclease n=1 Tax=Flavobacterium cheongpyeongense TaxID=2212651 RepID=A0A2V4BN45_9FLAO|nr:winged helix-turn-helix domain-containing protein [Flavobacterium cheongpyeongense]PXY40408.1 restriction endonuclease [Flavobacterium cheongpyeongense]
MSVPDFQTIMLPFLQNLSDGNKQSISQVMENLANHFKLTPEDLSLQVPSGKMGLFRNRVGWSRSYLKNAGLVNYPERGVYQITQVGVDFLKTNPKKLRMQELLQFPMYNEWRSTFNSNTGSQGLESESSKIEEEELTPQEKLTKTIDAINQQLASDILDALKGNTFQYFEKFVVQLLQSMGYGGFRKDSGMVTGASGDNGIDGVILQDVLGLESVGIQAKRFTTNNAGSGDIRNFIGSLAIKGFSKGVFLTTSSFSPEAIKTASESKQHKIILIDGKKLANLAIEFNVGVQIDETIQLKRIDMDFFDEIN